MHFKNAVTLSAIGKGQPTTKGAIHCFFSNVLVPGQRVYNKNKTKHYIENHKTIKLADQFKSLHISILSQDALNKIEKPLCE